MVHDPPLVGRVADRIRRTVNFTLRYGGVEVCGCITFEALQRLARVQGDASEIAEQLFDRYQHDIEQLALARYAAGDFVDGVIYLDASDLRPLVGKP